MDTSTERQGNQRGNLQTGSTRPSKSKAPLALDCEFWGSCRGKPRWPGRGDVTDRWQRGQTFSSRLSDRQPPHLPLTEKHGELCGRWGDGKMEEKRVAGQVPGIIVLTHFASLRPTVPSNSHCIFARLLLAIPAVVCIRVNNLNWLINGITGNLLKEFSMSIFLPEH